jgi:hypothetical protein
MWYSFDINCLAGASSYNVFVRYVGNVFFRLLLLYNVFYNVLPSIQLYYPNFSSEVCEYSNHVFA